MGGGCHFKSPSSSQAVPGFPEVTRAGEGAIIYCQAFGKILLVLAEIALTFLPMMILVTELSL